MNTLTDVINYFALAFEIVGALIVIWGGLHAILVVCKNTFQGKTIEKVHFVLGHKMIIGLEFFLASDIIQTIITPDWASLAQLATIAAIRTALSFFLQREIKEQKVFAKNLANLHTHNHK